MKIIHLSDLHLGKRVNDFPMIEDQKFILEKILKIVDDEKPDAIVIAGDIYDKSIPPVEAVSLFDDFLTKLMNRKMPVLVISGNHDSAERVSFGNKLMEASNIYFAPAYNGSVSPITLKDKYGDVNFYLLPFIKPAIVRPYFEEQEIETYTDAMKAVIEEMHIDNTKRNVLVAHQCVLGASTCDSEEPSVGGLDNIDVSVFKDFDYVALGHLHGPQNISSEKICYSGTPLKYSFSECGHKKGVKVVTLNEKVNGEIKAEHKMIPLTPLHDMRKIKGSYEELMTRTNYEKTNTDDYVHITLTDENDIINGFSKLQSVYKNIMKLEYENHNKNNKTIGTGVDPEIQSPVEIFNNFYIERNGREMSEDQLKYLKDIVEKVWEDEE